MRHIFLKLTIGVILIGASSFLDYSRLAPDHSMSATLGSVGVALTSSPSVRCNKPEGDPTQALYSPDEKTILISREKGQQVELWDTTTLTLNHLYHFIGTLGRLDNVTFSPDGKIVLTYGEELGMAVLWDAQTGTLLRDLPVGVLFDEAFSPDGKTLLTGGRDVAQLWDVRSGMLLYTFPNPNEGRYRSVHVAYSPDGKTIVTDNIGEGEGGFYMSAPVHLWDAQSGALLRTLDSGDQLKHGLTFSPLSNTLLTFNRDGMIELWDVSSGTLRQTVAGIHAAYSPDGRNLFMSNQGGTASLWDAQTGNVLYTLHGTYDEVTSVAYSPDGRTLLTGSQDGTVSLWDAQSGNMLYSLHGHHDEITSVSYALDGRTFLTNSNDRATSLWNTQSGKLLYTLQNPELDPHGIGFSPDGQHLVGWIQGAMLIWEAQSGMPLHTVYTDYSYSGDTFRFSPDGKTLLAIGDDTIQRRDIQTGAILSSLSISFPKAYSPDGKMVLVPYVAGSSQIWEIDSGRALDILSQAAEAGSFSPDGKTLATISQKRVVIWDVASDIILHSFPIPEEFMGLPDVDYAPDGQTVITEGATIGVRLWDVKSGSLIQTLSLQHEHAVYSPDGKTILTSRGDHGENADLWDAHTGTLRFSLHDNATPPSFTWMGLIYAPNGKTVVTAPGYTSYNYGPTIWEVQSGQRLYTLPTSTFIESYSSDGNTLLTGEADSGIVQIRDAYTGAVLRQFCP